mgnify:CR=1 FL=1
MYNLEATPAEGTTYRFAREDRKRWPDILQVVYQPLQIAPADSYRHDHVVTQVAENGLALIVPLITPRP